VGGRRREGKKEADESAREPILFLHYPFQRYQHQVMDIPEGERKKEKEILKDDYTTVPSIPTCFLQESSLLDQGEGGKEPQMATETLSKLDSHGGEKKRGGKGGDGQINLDSRLTVTRPF